MRLSQSEQDLTLTGTRPPSACSTSRPSSGRSSRRGYVKVANTSMADELLFSSSANQMKLEDPAFDAPWVTKKDRRQILLWSPAPSSGRSARATTPLSETPDKTGSASTRKKTPKIKDTMLKTRHPFKLVKNTPTFVDECLFGPRLQEPSFKAPWNIKQKKPVATPQRFPAQWSGNDSDLTVNGVTKLNFRYRPRSRVQEESSAKPAWKP